MRRRVIYALAGAAVALGVAIGARQELAIVTGRIVPRDTIQGPWLAEQPIDEGEFDLAGFKTRSGGTEVSI